MRVEDLPKEFKFKATEDLRLNLVFVLMLIEQGFEVVGEINTFVSRYVISGLVYGFAIEDNKIVVFLNGGNEDCYLKDPVHEVFVHDFDFNHSISDNAEQVINKQVLVGEVIKLLSNLDLASLTNKEILDVNAIKLMVSSMPDLT